MKKIVKLFYTILIILFSINVCASTNLLERTEENNWGVRKRIELTDTRLNIIRNTKYVNANEKIYDFSSILSEDDEVKIKEYVDKFINATGMDFVVLTDSVPYSYDERNAEYAVDFYDYNDFGLDYNKYSGVILFRNTYESDPYYGLYTTGYAQQYFPVERYDPILDDIYPYFKSKKYVEGIRIVVDELINYYNLGIPNEYSDSYLDENGNLIVKAHYEPPYLIVGIISFVITSIVIGVLVFKNKMVYKAKDANQYLDANSIKYSKKESHLVSTHTTSRYIPPSDSGGGSFGGGSSHSFSGSSGIGHGGGGRHG